MEMENEAAMARQHQNTRTPGLILDDLGELVFGVARIFASFNDTFVHVTDLR